MTSHSTLFIAPTRIGDAILASSLLAHIAKVTPSTRVTIVTSPLAAPLYDGYPLLECTHAIQKQRYNRHWLTAWRATFPVAWDDIWDTRHSILSYGLRAKRRHIYKPGNDTIPKVQQYEKSLGIAALPYPVLWPRAQDLAYASHLLSDTARYLIFAPIANWPPKEWPLDHFIALAKTLLDQHYQGYRPIVICAAHERERALPMLAALEAYRPVDLTTGDAHLLAIYAIMQRAHGFIGNDSGLMHMAAAAGIPTLGLFGPTPHEIYQPYGKQTAYLVADKGDLACLEPGTVAKKFMQMIPP